VTLDLTAEPKLYELLPVGASKGRAPHIIRKRRVLIGRSQACDVVLGHNEITAIHAVLEINRGSFRVFDMNSRNGSYVNGKKIVAENLKLNDTVKFGPLEFQLREYEGATNLKPAFPDVIPGMLTPRPATSRTNPIPAPPQVLDQPVAKPQLPQTPASTDTVGEEFPDLPTIVYPLAKDPNSEFSEYIFEDADLVYPIFKYDFKRTAVEVIIIFRDKIYSVDYIQRVDGVYKLVGMRPKSKEIEYAYLGKKDRFDFIEVKGNDIFVNPLPGYEMFSLNDGERTSGTSIFLGEDDILRFTNGDLQVYVRPSDAPPYVKPAPIFRRDSDLKKYLLLMFIFCALFMTSMSLFQVDKELEQEKAPERIATILYQRKPVVSPNPAVDKTPEQPKEVVQKSPQQTRPEQRQETPEVRQQEQAQAQARPGTQTTQQTGEVRQAQPNQGPDRQRDQVRPQRQQTAQPSRPTPAAAPREAQAQTQSQGHVETYQSPDFSSNISSIVARGGATRTAESQASAAAARTESGVATGGESATLQRAEVSTNVGSLTGAAQGRLDEARGVEGITAQRNIYTAGLPFKEVVLGGMDPDTIRRILIDHIPQFRHCYQRELDRAATEFDGVVRLDFVIGASGHVTRAGVQTASDTLPVAVRQCVVNVLRGIKFPAPLGGGVVEVNQPFNFYPRRS
jgi:pSer/pThr/pTyr-binding forkhead associated (FHA) protein